jgi:LDH2 family malate/lactate/ureidoglycolate dehydrogenase
MNIIATQDHNTLIQAAYQARGFLADESLEAAETCAAATWHGNNTHNALKALHLDDLFGSKTGGCNPGAEIEVITNRFSATEVWDAHKKLGQSVATRAFERAIELADRHGVGIVSVDNCFHYLWGGGYVINAAQRGYIAYTNCTSSIAEVVPYGGKSPTLGTNPHSWGLPTQDAIGFPVCVDWATSTCAMGRVQQLKREGRQLPPMAAVDAEGNPTQDPNQVAALLPFGAHKGYGLALINELIAAYIGGSLPSHRGCPLPVEGEKNSTSFFFQIIHPEAISSGHFAMGRDQTGNVKAVIENILGPGNEQAILPGQLEAEAAARSKQAGGLLFSDAELTELNELAAQLSLEPLDATSLNTQDQAQTTPPV